MSRVALGTARLDNRLDFVSSLRLLEDQIQQVSTKRWELDIPAQFIQKGRVSDVERWYSRFLSHFMAYWQLHSAVVEPAWTAVTGYYCAFYGTQTLLAMLGLGARTLPPVGVLPGGLYRLSEADSLYADHVVIQFQQQRAGSHKALWTQFAEVLSQLVFLPANDSRTTLILQSLRQLAIGPPALAAVRNQINYSIDFAPADLGAWPSELIACRSVPELERRLQVTVPSHPAQRFELVALGAASLSRALYDDYLRRGRSLDLRPNLSRRARLSRAGDEHPAWFWFQ